MRSISYRFIQPFKAPALDAYRWCTNYDSKDLSLMGAEGKRKINWLSEDTVILSDTYGKKNGVTKKKLVRLDPSTLSWTSTHIAGPIKYSQFLYRIVPDGKNSSHLEFTGLQLENSEMNNKDTRALANKIRKEDSETWKLLAIELNKDLGKKC